MVMTDEEAAKLAGELHARRGAVTRSRPLGFRAAGSMVRTAPRSVVIAGATFARSSRPSLVAFTVRVVL